MKKKKKSFFDEKKKIIFLKKKKNFFCDYCEKSFSSKAHKRRHEIHYCKSEKCSLIEEKDKQITRLINEKNEIYRKMDNLLDKVGNTTHITNNIHLNNYGNEDLTHLSKNQLTNFIKIPFQMIPKMVEAVHFNDEKPENKNIFIPNKKDNFVKVYKDNKWIYQDKNETIDTLVNNKYTVMNEHYEKTKAIEPCIKNNYLKFKTNYNNGNRELMERIKKDCEIILLNNR